MKDIQQLIKKNSQEGRYENIFPKTFIDAVLDKESGVTLTDILAMFNMLFLSYNGSRSQTRLQVPSSLRRKGLWVTYVLYDETVVTEWYSAEAIDDTAFGDSANWRDGSNALVGDIPISSDGYWVINGEVTNIKAQGEAGITPVLRVGSNNHLQVSYTNDSSYVDISPNPVFTQFRINNNKLEQSIDLGNTWTIASDYIAAWFRFTGTAGSSQADNVGKIQISRDNGATWSDLSGEFTNSLYIKGYVATVDALPSTAVQGDIYGVGPTYDSSDTEHTNPIYQLYVKNSTGWVNNGKFTSIAAGVVQDTGNSETAVMSQKVITEQLQDIFSYKGHLSNDGVFVSSELGYVTPFLKIPKENPTFVCYQTASEYGVVPSLCTYDNFGNFVKSYYVDNTSGNTGEDKGPTTLTISNLSANEVLMRIRQHNQSNINYFGNYQACRLENADGEVSINNDILKFLSFKRAELQMNIDITSGAYLTPISVVKTPSLSYATIDVSGWYGIKILFPFYASNGQLGVRFLDSLGNIIHSDLLVDDTQEVISVLVPENAVTAQFNIEKTVCYRIYDEPRTTINENIVPKLSKIFGKTYQFLMADGSVIDSNLQLLTDYIKIPFVDANKTNIKEGILLNIAGNFGDNSWGGIHFYDENFVWLGRVMTNYGYRGFKLTKDILPKGAWYFRVSPLLSDGYIFSTMPLTGVNPPISENVDDEPILYGKTWVCAGDSFSHGDYTDSATPSTSYLFQEGKYKDMNKVYSRFIALRNNMNLVLTAQNGATVGMLRTDSQFSNPDYNPSTDPPSNTNNFYWGQLKGITGQPDYITLWFGINDTANCDLGTINDETVKTFYGALNWSLLYLITNFPKTKIGLVVSNGDIGDTYRQAVIDVAQKWAIPYLDMKGDSSVPTIFGDRLNQSIPVDPRVVSLRRGTFYVSSTNGYPNEFAHEYESTFIESWLKTL